MGGKQELTLDITPQVTYTVTADGQTLSTKTETLDNSAIKAPVTISVALPLDMPQENLYVKHKLEDGSFEYIKPTIERKCCDLAAEQLLHRRSDRGQPHGDRQDERS